MPGISFSIGIATFNRSRLLGRAIQSVLDQSWPGAEILVVDDASVDDTRQFVANEYPQVRYLSQDRNQGCGAARNRALREASHPYLLILDDDDTLLPGALHLIACRMASMPDLVNYPVLNFAHGEATIPQPYLVAGLDAYIQGTLCGDFVPVICREMFLRENLSYPTSRVGGEHILWWKIANRYGIPTWADRVGTVHSDAPVRLTSVQSQMRHSREHAELQEETLSQFGDVLRRKFPNYYAKKLLGAAAYRLLSGDRRQARSHLQAALRWHSSRSAMGLWALSFLPLFVIRQCFLAYRTGNGVVV